MVPRLRKDLQDVQSRDSEGGCRTEYTELNSRNIQASYKCIVYNPIKPVDMLSAAAATARCSVSRVGFSGA